MFKRNTIRTLTASALLLAAASAAHALQPGELSDKAANDAIAAAEAQAKTVNAHVCIAVVDPSGILKAFKRMEGAPPGCVDSAIAKAHSAAVYRMATLAFQQRANNGEPALATLPGMTPLGGGVPAKSADGVWLGAVGAAGSTNPNEVAVANAGAQNLSGSEPGK